MGVWQAYGRERRALQLEAGAPPRSALSRRRRDDDRRARRDRRDRAGQPPQLRGARLQRGRAARPQLVRDRRPGRHPRACARGLQRRRSPAPSSRTRTARRTSITRTGERRCISWNGRIVSDRHRRGHADRGRGRHRAARRPGARAPHGLPRRADRPGQPHKARGARRRSRSPGPAATSARPRCSTSTSTTSSSSTTRSATPPATSCCARSPSASPPAARASDLLARHGGDEFMLLLADLDGDAARDRPSGRRRASWRRSSSRSGSRGTSSRSRRASASPRFPRTATTCPTCSRAPTPRSTRPSATGAASIRFAAGEQSPAAGRLTLTARLRRALARGEFELHYQPVFEVADGAAVAVEALLRWNDPERGMVPPGDFIPGAEDSGLIEPIGDWVVDAVIAQAAEWRAPGPDARHRLQRVPAPAALRRASPTAC